MILGNVRIAFIILTCIAAVIVVRLFDLQILNSDAYKIGAAYSQYDEEPIPATRGTVYDADGNVLARSAQTWKCYIIPEYFRGDDDFRKAVCTDLAAALDLDYDELMELTESEEAKEGEIQYAQKKYIKFKMEYSEKIALNCGNESDKKTLDPEGKSIRNTNPKCLCHKSYVSANGTVRYYSEVIKFETDSKRYYPMGEFCSSVLGFVNDDGVGLSGIERYFNSSLSGVDGKAVTYGSEINTNGSTKYDKTDGTGLVLTIDETIQYSLSKNLKEVYESSGGIGAYGIVMDVNTGAILGMESIGYKGSYDLNDPDALNVYYEKIADRAAKNDDMDYIQEIADNSRLQDREIIRQDIESIKAISDYEERVEFHRRRLGYYFKLQQRNNYLVSEIYHPGSVFKIFVASAVLEENILPEDYTYCCNGAIRVEDRTFNCHYRSGHGYQDLRKGLMNSCNPFFITMGKLLGSENFFKYFDAFGFTEKTGIESVEESSPYYYTVDQLSRVNLASSSFGQAFSITPIQLITGISAIANGGYLMKPYLVAKKLDANGNVTEITEPTVRRQVISEKTAAEVASMMEDVCKSGTGKNGYVAGYRVAGKTGTTQKYQESGVYVASFGCFAPADNPRIAVLIIVDEPKSEINGSTVCAPVAAKVVETALEYLGVERQYTEKELASLDTNTPGVIGKNPSDARRILEESGFNVRVIGDGETVVSQSPAGGQTIPKDGVVALYTTDDDESKLEVTVPDLSGMTASNVKKYAASEGLNVRISGNSGSSDMVSYDQSVPAGSVTEYGTIVTVYFKSYTDIGDGTVQ